MTNTIAWLKAHPLEFFLGLTLILTYAILFPLLGLEGKTDDRLFAELVFFYGARLGVYIPVLAGMLVTAWILPERSSESVRNRWPTFGVVWLLALVAATAELKRSAPSETSWLAMLVVAMPIALLPAYVVSSAYSRVTSLRDLLATLVHPRGKLRWYLVAVFAFPVMQIVGLIINNLLSGNEPAAGFQSDSEILLGAVVTFAFVFFYSGGINEEGGWRGFAQRRLQSRHSPLAANLLLWIYLVIWHIPNDLVQYREGGYLLVRIGLYPFITILFGWVYNRTRGSIMAPALFHASLNSLNVLQEAVPGTVATSVLFVLLALLAIVLDRMWKKLPADDPAVLPELG